MKAFIKYWYVLVPFLCQCLISAQRLLTNLQHSLFKSDYRLQISPDASGDVARSVDRRESSGNDRHGEVDEITARLAKAFENYGPESVALDRTEKTKSGDTRVSD